MDDDDIKAVLKQAIMGVEKGFFDSIGDKLVEKTLIEEEIAVSKGILYSSRQTGRDSATRRDFFNFDRQITLNLVQVISVL